MKILFNLLFGLLMIQSMFAQQVWQNQMDGKRPSQIAIDNNGAVIIAGTIDYGVSQQSLTDFYVTKVSATGDSLWAKAVNGNFSNAEDDALCVGVDNNGNIYVGGYQQADTDWWKDDYLLIKFDAAGNELWRRVYNGTDNHQDRIQSLIVDQNGDVYVSGFSHETINSSTNQNITTIKYSTNGDSLWMHSWDSPINSTEYFKNMHLHNNELIITGQTVITSFPLSVYAPFILKYDTNGNVLFDSLYTTNGITNVILGSDLDGSGNIYLLTLHDQTIFDGKIEITKYDSNGNQTMQTHFLPDSAWVYSEYITNPIQVDNQGEITICMYAQTVTNWPWTYEGVVAKFDAAGTMQWYDRQTMSSTSNNVNFLLKKDNMGNHYVARQVKEEVSPFVYVDKLVIDKYDDMGNIIWSVWDDTLHNGSGGNNKQVVDLVPDASGNIYVTYSVRLPNTGNKDWLRTLKYDTSIPTTLEVPKTRIPKEIKLKQNYPNPFNPITKIEYTLPKSQFVTIKVFNILGELQSVLVNENKNAGTHIVNFDGSKFSSGVYLYQIQTASTILNRKMMLIK